MLRRFRSEKGCWCLVSLICSAKGAQWGTTPTAEVVETFKTDDESGMVVEQFAVCSAIIGKRNILGWHYAL
jgi:hypothetical protein